MKKILLFGFLLIFIFGCNGVNKQELIDECIPCCEANPEFGYCEEMCESHIKGDHPIWARSHQDFVDIMCQRSEQLDV